VQYSTLMPYAVVALFGLALGSFLNVCIFRLPRHESVVTPRSRCPHCSQLIRWYDNVPVFGWLWLGGKCRKCRAPISPQYPLVEFIIGVVWAASAWAWGLSWHAAAAAVFGTLLIGIALTDARHYIIPHEFTLGGLSIDLPADTFWLHVGSVNVQSQDDGWVWSISAPDGTFAVNAHDGGGWVGVCWTV